MLIPIFDPELKSTPTWLAEGELNKVPGGCGWPWCGPADATHCDHGVVNGRGDRAAARRGWAWEAVPVPMAMRL